MNEIKKYIVAPLGSNVSIQDVKDSMLKNLNLLFRRVRNELNISVGSDYMEVLLIEALQSKLQDSNNQK